ncbi:MAG TPA: hypothetical protein VFB04_15930 [Terriglobales bacterium]|nr:hypothetical protein [Terriglobales bacterium]
MLAFMVVGVFDQSSVFALFGCMLFAAALFVYVFYQPGEVEAGEEKTRQMYLLERKEATYENLRDLSFEYKAGKLSEQDYAIQRAALEDEAAAILAELEQIEKARVILRKGTRPAGMRTNGGRA